MLVFNGCQWQQLTANRLGTAIDAIIPAIRYYTTNSALIAIQHITAFNEWAK